ncbi:MAG: hypothetical protein ACREA9_17550 [Pyrinomonadaceae bacterium]
MKFSIRDLFWFTTLAAVFCAWQVSLQKTAFWAYRAERAESHYRVLEEGWRQDLAGEFVRGNEMAKTLHVLASEVVELRKQRDKECTHDQ